MAKLFMIQILIPIGQNDFYKKVKKFIPSGVKNKKFTFK